MSSKGDQTVTNVIAYIFNHPLTKKNDSENHPPPPQKKKKKKQRSIWEKSPFVSTANCSTLFCATAQLEQLFSFVDFLNIRFIKIRVSK